MQGRFITFEGGEGAGKTTQIRRLKARLETHGLSIVVTREPGGSPAAEEIRKMLLSGAAKQFGPRGEAMLFAAARANHVDSIILPAIEQGHWVLCDRFSDSTWVYQGEAGVDPSLMKALEVSALAGVYPDLTILIDVPVEIGLKRIGLRHGEGEGPDRFERDTLETHERRRKRFLELAYNEPDRIAVVDGSVGEEDVAEAIWNVVQNRFVSELAPVSSLTEDRVRSGGA